jgi:signal transduction histidine kinase/DNA-binding NarL/FixJ family response regulator
MTAARRLLPTRLGPRLVLLSALITLALAPLLTGLYFWVSHESHMQRQQEQIDEIAHASLPALREALWLGDAALVQSHLEGLKHFQDMARVDLVWADNSKPPLVLGERPAAKIGVIEKRVEISTTFKGREMALGTLTLTLSLERTEALMRREVWLILLTQTLQVLALAALILLAYQRLAGRRLQRMGEFLNDYGAGAGARRMPVAASDKSNAGDELDLLAIEFNSLLDAQEENIRRLQEANATLEAEIGVRQRAEVALVQARDAAEAANRAKSAFLANMSHELRTPLNAILGFAQLMARDARIPESQRRNLDTINRSGQHLLSLINDVLEISRIEAGRLQAQKEPFDLDTLLSPLVDSMALRARDKGIDLRMELAPDLPRHVTGDAGKLRQILLNLLSNAVKYTERGSVVLSARCLARTGGEGAAARGTATLRFAVADTGVGISAEDIRQIYQPFFQAEYGIRRGEGTGLGLTISQEYTRLLGGELGVESTPGVGSTFTLTVPVELAAEPAPVAPSPGRVVGLAPGQPVPRILVAEDNPDSRRLLVEILENGGCEVRAVDNGREAVRVFGDWRPDFIWMDMRMPVMDGYAATGQIRTLPGGDGVKIVALTASAFREDRGAILAAGCDDVLPKPVAEDRLFETMGRLLGLAYVYASPLTAEAAAAADLSALAPALRDELAAAARLLDDAAVRALIERIRDRHPQPAALLARLLEAYRFDVIAELCGTDAPPNA